MNHQPATLNEIELSAPQYESIANLYGALGQHTAEERQAALVDARGERKPQPRAWVSKKTVWFTLFRKASPTHLRAGQWIPITRTHPATPTRVQMVKRVLAGRAAQSVQKEMVQA